MRLSGTFGIVIAGVMACSSYVGTSQIGTTRDADNGEVSTSDAAQDVVSEATSWDGPRPICGSGLGECDPVAGTGCPSGQHCAISGATSLVVSCIDDGAGAPGAACVGPADCESGLHCISSRCLRLCCTRSDDATCRTGPGSSSSACGISLVATDGGVSFRACTATGICDWLTQQGCGSNQICLPSTPFGDGRCAPAGEGLLGQPCVEGNACVRGLFCAAPSGSPTSRRCALICDPRLMDCAGGRICRQVQGYPGNFGACL
jgi:hypothetical protein